MSEKIDIEVKGLIKEPRYFQAKVLAEGLYQKYDKFFHEPKCCGMLEYKWKEFITELKKKHIADVSCEKTILVVAVGDNVFSGIETFVKWCDQEYQHTDGRPLALFEALAVEEYKQHLLNTQRDYVYFDVSIDKKPQGRLVFELFTDKLPETCRNFRELCEGSQVEKSKHDPPLKLSYQESILHRIVPNGWIQGGDIVSGKGTGGWSIYGELFPDENYSVLHTKRGLLGMVNKGRHSNASQFYITLQQAPWMDTHYVAFGEVVEGLELLEKLEQVKTYNERPLQPCIIHKCGKIDLTVL